MSIKPIQYDIINFTYTLFCFNLLYFILDSTITQTNYVTHAWIKTWEKIGKRKHKREIFKKKNIKFSDSG